MQSEKPCKGPCRIIGLSVVILGLLALGVSMFGCAHPSRGRLKDLLSQCRQTNRERARIIRELPKECRVSSAPMGQLEFGEAGQ